MGGNQSTTRDSVNLKKKVGSHVFTKNIIHSFCSYPSRVSCGATGAPRRSPRHSSPKVWSPLLPCPPCLSSSKRHAICMGYGCFDLINQRQHHAVHPGTPLRRHAACDMHPMLCGDGTYIDLVFLTTPFTPFRRHAACDVILTLCLYHLYPYHTNTVPI